MKLATWLILGSLCGLTACGGGQSDKPAANTPQGTLGQVVVGEPRMAAAAVDSTDWPPPVDDAHHQGCDTQPLIGSHQTYNVGPGQAYTELSDVPWMSMQAGDVVNVFPRATPYAAKVGLRVRATAAAPFYLHGVSDPTTCAKPTITGQGARASADQQALPFGAPIETLGLIGIWRGPNDPDNSYKPAWIIIENLRMIQVGDDHQFQAYDGSTKAYNGFSAAIYAVRVDHLHVRDCEFEQTAMGVFVNTRGQSSVDFSSDVRLIRNRFNHNGRVGSDTIHNVYVQARRALYEGNDLRALRTGAGGSTLKDRSSATVVRFNRIASNARAIDLVETEEEYVSNVQTDPLYPHAWVYGNLIVNDFDQPNGASVNMVHFGYDNTAERARTGTLYYYGNTVIQAGPQSKAWYAHVFQVSDASSTPLKVLGWNNIFANLGTVEFRFMGQAGQLQLVGGNSLPPNWVEVYPGNPGTVSTSGGTVLSLANPGLNPDYTPSAGSQAIGAARVYTPTWPSGVVSANLRLDHQFSATTGMQARSAQGTLGAFER